MIGCVGNKMLPVSFPHGNDPLMNPSYELYLDLMMRCLTDWIYDGANELARAEGRDWPSRAHTMIGLKRLANVRYCVEAVLDENVAGDLIETGVWRGGAVIFMRAILKAREVTDRIVWGADSFAGLPPPDVARFPQDEGISLHRFPQLAIPLERVEENFKRYGLLDDQVRFVKGWFRDTLPNVPIKQLAVLRLDGDLYESTIQALDGLYPKLSAGGFVIVDDYGNIPACRQAVDDFRAHKGITDIIRPIDWGGVYWRRSSAYGGNL
jgi:Macrocin-O-methyltransferase (TylF)